jgi:hypothetical protein
MAGDVELIEDQSVKGAMGPRTLGADGMVKTLQGIGNAVGVITWGR